MKNKCNLNSYAIIGYQLDKTLSEHGTVSRGVCEVDKNGNLLSIKERTKIYPENNKVIYEEDERKYEVPANSSVSMNFWCFHPSVFDRASVLFKKFLAENHGDIKSEFFIPIFADEFIKGEANTIMVIPTSSQWFGVTYKEDAAAVKKSIDKLISDEVYPASLWG